MTAIIKVQDLTVKLENTVLLNHINFTIKKGQTVTILGSSGCGKSTLMRHMIGLQKPFSGQVLVQDKPVNELSHLERCCNMGVMFQSGALLGSMTVRENVQLALDIWTPLPFNARRQLALEKLHLVGLEHASEIWPSELSGGMQKRVAIARAMVMEPDILMLDEPSAGLDPITAYDLDALLRRVAYQQEVTLVVVTHELASIFRLADRAIFLKDGKIAADGPPAKLAENEAEPEVQKFLNLNKV